MNYSGIKVASVLQRAPKVKEFNILVKEITILSLNYVQTINQLQTQKDETRHQSDVCVHTVYIKIWV